MSLQGESAKSVDADGWLAKWSKWFGECKARRPRLLFCLIMGIETLNFATDVAQLATVVDRYSVYEGPPWMNSFVDGNPKWGLVWEMLSPKTPGDPYLLAMPLPWVGDPHNLIWQNLDWEKKVPRSSGVYYEILRCFTQAEMDARDNFPSYMVLSRPQGSQKVCVPISFVFKSSFYSKVPCPNNKTAVFDEYSYAGVSDTTPLGSGVLSSYLPNWQDKVLGVNTCRTLYNIFVGTIFIFALECVIIFANLIRSVYNLFSDNDKVKRATSLVEFPLIGFFLVLFMKDEDLAPSG